MISVKSTDNCYFEQFLQYGILRARYAHLCPQGMPENLAIRSSSNAQDSLKSLFDSQEQRSQS